jgi:hypothetical protein
MANKLSLYEDVDLPAGSVVVAVAQADAANLGLTVARKNTDRPFLGPHGWQAGEHVFTPSAIRNPNGHSEMVFGDELTRHIGVDMNVTLSVPALAISERHFWPSITAAPGQQGVSIHRVLATKPMVATGPSATQAQTVEEQNLIFDAIPPGGATGPTNPVIGDITPTPQKRQTWQIAAAVLIVLLIAGGILAYFYFPAGDSAPQEAGSATTAPPDFTARYRAYLGQAGQAEALLALGREALAGNATEVGFNAVTLSADRGFAPAKFLLGQWYDPLTEARGPARANPNNAALYYAETSARGQADAVTALRRLCQTAKASPAPIWAETFDTGTHCP